MTAEPTRSALITGASSGIGAQLAQVLASRGVTVGLVARRADRLAEVLDTCRQHAPDSQMFVADLADNADVDRIANEVWAALGGIDILVNNAATPGVRLATNLTPDDVDRVMQVNFNAPVRLTLALLPKLIERGGGTIVNISSLGGRLGIAREAAYCASKFALCGFSESLALDLWDTPVNVKLIIPGAVDTEIWDRPHEDAVAHEVDKVPALDVAIGIADAIDSDRFEHYLPDMLPIALFKTKDIDEYMARSIEAMQNEGH